MTNHEYCFGPAGFTGVLTAVLIIGSMSGCMTTRMEETKNAATGILEGERVVIMEASYHTGNETEDKFIDCVSKGVQKGRNGIDVFPDEDFVDALFPWFEPRTMPQGPDALPDLFTRPGVTERMRDSGVRYIVWVTGETEQSASGGSLSCAVAPGGGGCFGLAWWEDDASYSAAVWDVRNGRSAGEVSANVHGTSVIPALVIPVPLIARTQAAACKGLARELQSFLIGSGPL